MSMTACEWDSTTGIAHYARLARELRGMAAQVKSAEAREEMILLAVRYEHLAEHATGFTGSSARIRQGDHIPAQAHALQLIES